MKKVDLIIILSVLVAAVLCFCVIFFGGESGKKVKISQNNAEVYSGYLHENKIIELGTNTIEINGGKIKMIHANCKNQVCVNHKEISKKGESIICLPNKVIVEIS